MSETITAENLINNLVETIVEKQAGEKSNSVSSQLNRLFGRQKPVHHLLGGGKSADVLLWRNKKISASVLTSATIIWVLFEWLNYHFLSLLCFALVLGMFAQFLWSNASGLLNSAEVPRLVVPEDFFVYIASAAGDEVNRVLKFLQDVACGGNLKQFLIVVGSLIVASVVGCWCNFLTLVYIGFVVAHTLPVIYEKYEDEIDNFVVKVFEELQKNIRNIPQEKVKEKKHD